jgi:hypothetical protein
LEDEKGEGNANYYAASEKEQHLPCVWFMKLNCNLAFFHGLVPLLSFVGWLKLGCK